jgi:hypothetical protein
LYLRWRNLYPRERDGNVEVRNKNQSVSNEDCERIIREAISCLQQYNFQSGEGIMESSRFPHEGYNGVRSRSDR